ncbi:oxidoreductase [Chitinophaga nivalis]|uniref:Oxidoreductase n=1 Tax=Chitinophaga nivalis TaxID=2991709 RepID=A0ABT3IK67_9BACT|nr:oxidoreductase [Chitinophaga nivalis]MCW3465991.1 oxidoreductase [Chitinophaga nivalis]MCW3484318.1 oxidoreductase [Chitinophaga nivalis]
MKKQKVWFITGCTRGLGRSLTAAVLANGDLVAGAARTPAQLQDLVAAYPDQLYPLQLDVTDDARIPAAVAEAIAHFGRIDVLVNNAGYGIAGATEGYTNEQVQGQLATNLYGPIAITRAVLPYMRAQRAGRILQISSIGGRVGSIGLSVYQAAKFGLGGFSEALSKEVEPLNIKVTSIEPGGFRTDWADSSMSFAPHVDGYETTADWRKQVFIDKAYVPAGDPDKAAAAIITVAEHPEPPVHLLLGNDAAGIVQQADLKRQAEMEKWLPVTTSTDADDAESFLETAAGKRFLK